MEQRTLLDRSVKKQYITLLSVISAFSVVLLHTNECFWNFSTAHYWFTANIIEETFDFAVPVFFMISGATLFDYQDRCSTKEFFIRRVKKTVIPFIAWSFIGLAYQLVRKRILVEELNLKFVLNGILETSIVGVYWFFTSLFCIYLCIPLFAAVARDKRKAVFTYLAVAGFVINFLVPFLKGVFAIDISWPFSISVISGSLIYAVIGYLLDNYEMPKKGVAVIYVLSIVGILVQTMGTYCLSIEAGSLVQRYRGYNNVPCIMYSVGVFLFFKKHGDSIMKLPVGKVIRFLGEYTFGIYLIHIYLIQVVKDYLFYNVLGINFYSIVYRLFAPFVVVPIAVLVVYVLRKIPIVRNIVP